MNILVVGGAGYIGSHAVKQLIEAGHRVAAVDNLFRGHRQAVHPAAAFHEADLGDTAELGRLLRTHEIDCVMHFAALAYVGESVSDPLAYYANNIGGLVNTLQVMQRHGVKPSGT